MCRAQVLLFWCLCGIPLLGLGQNDDSETAIYAPEVLTLGQARPLTLVGSSQLRVAFFTVFNSKLFTKTGQWNDPRHSFRFELTYQRNISGSFLAKQTAKEWDHLDFEDPRRSEWEAAVLTMWPDVKKGDRIAFDVDEQGVSRFFYNGTWVGSVEDPDFAPAFIAIWLSPETSRPTHRKGLLADS
tara:strand:+ start:721 stop:1275 length:555 start_codon:yes stop_codon:yes gene_type:complete